MNYLKLMSHTPTQFGSIINNIGQEICFYEHPLMGCDAPVIIVCHQLKLADSSDFMETDDMAAEDSDYQPSFVDGKLYIGEFQN